MNLAIDKMLDSIFYKSTSVMSTNSLSFTSVNAVFCTPALPAMAIDFHINAVQTENITTWHLVGYAVGQLIYALLTWVLPQEYLSA